MKIAVFGNRCQDGRAGEIRRLFAALSVCGARVAVERGFREYVEALLPGIDAGDVAEDDGAGADVAVSVGGDGTFLRTAARIGDKEIPILGVNTGHLGYLSDVPADAVDEVVAAVAAGDFRTESRSVLRVDTADAGGSVVRFALNEVAVLKDASSSMLCVDATVDGVSLNTYLGDGLIVATPTGSTAYNLSVGGPILHPSCRCFVVSPVAAHSLTVRPLVLPDNVEIAVTARSGRAHSFLMAADGDSLSLPVGTTLRIRKAPFVVKVVLRPDHDFAGTLRNKLIWGADAR